MHAAAEIAREIINDRDDILRDYIIELPWNNSKVRRAWA